MTAMSEPVETRLTEMLRAGALDELATLALETYGPEVYGFLLNLMGGSPDARDVFSQAIEDFWRRLPGFRGQCSVRTWLYMLAQHVAWRYRRSPWNRGQRTGVSKVEELVAAVQSRTSPWQRTDIKDKWHELREALDPEDRAILVLRVDRDLEWNEIARVMLGESEQDHTTVELAREAARLRKRFQLLKEELRERARAAGLVEEP
jgi:RNA polymerase sigma-70 factor (ECF subfamily)